MNKTILISLAGVIAVGGVIGFSLLGKTDESSKADTEASAECVSLCAEAKSACPSLIDTQTCENKCPSFSEETKEHLKNSTTCEQLTKSPELISDVIIPDAAPKPQEKTASNDCEAACGKYVNACLMLVPNASDPLYEDGYNSCLKECSGWSATKTECMINAFDCPAMTEVCGL
jgi:hypothetical protein